MGLKKNRTNNRNDKFNDKQTGIEDSEVGRSDETAWTTPFFGYPPNEYFWKREPYVQYNFHGYNEIRITNVVPLLMSMTLLGLREFTAQNSPNLHLSQELEPPIVYNSDPDATYKVASTSSLNADILNSMRSGRIIETISQHRSLNKTPINFSYNDILIPSSEFEPPLDDFADEQTPGPAMELVYAWKTIDFEFENDTVRDRALFDEKYIPENNLPLGLEFWQDKVFITVPKWRSGVPATLATVQRYSMTKSPKLQPYPSWGWHNQDTCGGMTSVFRIQVDECDRLWVLDSGTVNLTSKSPQQICPPAIFIFDLRTDRLLKHYQLPEDQVKQDSLWSNIVVDIRDGRCGLAKAYMSDVFRYQIIVYDLFTDTSFRIQHPYFYPDPLAARYEFHGIRFYWNDGIFSLALSPIDINNDRTLFFHPMSSFREFAISTSLLSDRKTAEANLDSFVPVGKQRAKDFGHSSGSAIDRSGIMFFNMVTRDSVWCWDTRKEYIPQNLGLVGVSNETLIFPNDLRVDNEDRQSFWTISNRLPIFLYGNWNPHDVNFRVYRAYVNDAVRDTVCDPNYLVTESENSYEINC